eukprot:729156_1
MAQAAAQVPLGSILSSGQMPLPMPQSLSAVMQNQAAMFQQPPNVLLQRITELIQSLLFMKAQNAQMFTENAQLRASVTQLMTERLERAALSGGNSVNDMVSQQMVKAEASLLLQMQEMHKENAQLKSELALATQSARAQAASAPTPVPEENSGDTDWPNNYHSSELPALSDEAIVRSLTM